MFVAYLFNLTISRASLLTLGVNLFSVQGTLTNLKENEGSEINLNIIWLFIYIAILNICCFVNQTLLSEY